MKTAEEYRASLKNRRPLRVFWNGELLESPFDHPVVKASVNSVAETYEIAHMDDYIEISTTKSSLSGASINRFTHLHQSNEDLLKKIKMQRLLGQRTGTCFQRCVGMDALNAVFSTTYKVDAKHGTAYHERFKKFTRLVQEEDLVVDGAMTDPKGDRAKRPSEQSDPDLYMRIVERRPEGIVIRGAKAHQTGAINSHYHLVMPTLQMRLADKDYAFCCAVPVDHESITYLYGRQSCDLRVLDESENGRIDCGNPCFGGQECLVVFNDVFVPNEMIFLDGEVEFTGFLVESFAGYHRQSYCCKVGVGDVAIGAAQALAEANGVEKASHVKDKIIEMNLLNETIFACGVSAATLGKKTEAGNYMVDLMSANVCKQHVTRFPYEIARLLQDIAGGLMVTLPSSKELENPETREIVLKYLATVDGYDPVDRIRLLRLVENLTMGRAAVGYLVESLHGAGSPQAQRIMIQRLANLGEKKKLAYRLAGVSSRTQEGGKDEK